MPDESLPRNGRGKQRRRRLLTTVKSDPEVLFKDARCRKPEFCADLFELCDGLALSHPTEAIVHARAAVKLTEEIGARHLENGALGVLVHAHIARREHGEAEAVLDRYQKHAYECCTDCTNDYLQRRADLLVETRRAGEAQEILDRCLAEMGDEAGEDRKARARFIRCISFHFQRDPARALEDAGQALMELAFASPRGYFVDTLAFVACFLQSTQQDARRQLAEKALDFLLRFKERIKGLEDWTDVRNRLFWVEGAVLAVLGDHRRAADRLECGRLALMETGPVRHAVAIAVDLSLLLCRRLHESFVPHENNVWALRRINRTCLRELDLDVWLRRRLKKIEEVLAMEPEKAYRAFSALRRSMIVSVPGLL